MKHAVEMSSVAMIAGFIRTGSGIQTLKGGIHRYIDTQGALR
jgi:hypothetical protein